MKLAVNYLKRKQLKENSQGLLAKYILEHKYEINEMTIRALAEQAYVSTAVATRLAKDFGCSGFSDVKIGDFGRGYADFTSTKSYELLA